LQEKWCAGQYPSCQFHKPDSQEVRAAYSRKIPTQTLLQLLSAKQSKTANLSPVILSVFTGGELRAGLIVDVPGGYFPAAIPGIHADIHLVL
jgi:hypothetical protein